MEVGKVEAFYGTIVHSISSTDPLVNLNNALVIVRDRKITYLKSDVTESEVWSVMASHQLPKEALRILASGEFLIPGFVDTHIHAPQYTFAGVGYDLPLLEWLKRYTYPAETRFSDVEFARHAYEKVVRRTLRNGTTTACYFATTHLEATLVLAEVMDRYGQRGFVGKVNMDRNAPENYCETTESSLADTERFIEIMRERYGLTGLLTPCITPRFAISCTKELMDSLGKLSQKFDLPVQTHLSENKDEIDYVIGENSVDEYIHVYEEAGLLTHRTILAHCVHSSCKELQVMRSYKCGIAHCPNSNTSIKSGMMDVMKVKEADVKLGLGTDVAAGYSASVHDSIRKALEISKLLHVFKGKDYQNIPYQQAFFLATLGGAQVMNIDDKVGNFLVGKEFDALVINTEHPGSPFDVFDIDTQENKIEKFIYCGDDRNISEVYVAGRKIDLQKQ